MRYQSRETKPRSSFIGRLTRATVLVIVLPLAASSGCTSVEMRSMDDVKGLAGTWEGKGYATDSNFLSMTLVIKEDGSYELTGSVNAKGTIKMGGNHIDCGPFKLWAYDSGKSRILHGVGNGARVSFSRTVKGPH